MPKRHLRGATALLGAPESKAQFSSDPLYISDFCLESQVESNEARTVGEVRIQIIVLYGYRLRVIVTIDHNVVNTIDFSRIRENGLLPGGRTAIVGAERSFAPAAADGAEK